MLRSSQVWESLIAMLNEAFHVQLEEKMEFKKQSLREVRHVHAECIGKLEHYIPVVAKLTDEIQR